MILLGRSLPKSLRKSYYNVVHEFLIPVNGVESTDLAHYELIHAWMRYFLVGTSIGALHHWYTPIGNMLTQIHSPEHAQPV